MLQQDESRQGGLYTYCICFYIPQHTLTKQDKYPMHTNSKGPRRIKKMYKAHTLAMLLYTCHLHATYSQCSRVLCWQTLLTVIYYMHIILNYSDKTYPVQMMNNHWYKASIYDSLYLLLITCCYVWQKPDSFLENWT